MRVHILSDLHVEFAPFQPNNVDASVIVLAGDVHTGKNGIKWILKTFPDRPAIYVLGNHEFYGQNIPKLIEEIKEVAQGTNIHVLENESVEIGNVVFLGATLWTDFRLNGDSVLAEVTAQTEMTDFRRIRVTPSYRRFRPPSCRFHPRRHTYRRKPARLSNRTAYGLRPIIRRRNLSTSRWPSSAGGGAQNRRGWCDSSTGFHFFRA